LARGGIPVGQVAIGRRGRSAVHRWLRMCIGVENAEPDARLGQIPSHGHPDGCQPVVRECVGSRDDGQHVDACGETTDDAYLRGPQSGSTEKRVGGYRGFQNDGFWLRL
jgi:hypothetical protein